MTTVKISELPLISQINANTANTLFAGVDIPTSATFRMTAKTIAQGLYSNEILNVGSNPVVYPGVSAQFAGNNSTYLQVNLQNFGNTGSSDYVASTADSDNSTRYIDMGIDGPTYSDPVNYPFFKPYDGYLYVYGPSNTSSSGNLIVGTASSNSTITFITGLSSYKNVVAKMTSTGLVLNTQSSITFADGSVQSVAGSPANYSQAAFTLANNNSVLTQAAFNVANTSSANTFIIQGVDVTQNSRITIIEGTNTTQNTNISATDGKMQSAFTKANNALANTSGAIFGGDLNVTGNVTMIGIAATGQLTVNTALVSATEAAVRITGSNNAVVIEPQNDGYMLQITGKPNLPTRVVLDSFGANTYGLLAGRSARGSASAPTATQSGDVLLRLAGNGYGTTQFAPLGVSRIDIEAAENFTDAARGSKIKFFNVPNGSNTVTQIAEFNANSVTFTGTVEPQKGFVYTPRVLVGAQTAITIDFRNDSMIRATLTADLTVSLSNYIAGKVVEVWLTNTGGTGRTVTHGCSATNSSENATTFTIPATSSAFIRYFSIDGDLANTFVTSIHA
jgi:hypothetical protein